MTTPRLSLLVLSLLLAACTQPVPTPLVEVDLAAPVTFTDALRPQGITLNGADQHFKVTVRDGAGRVVHFNGGTFEPTGQGAGELTLSTANNFQLSVALPEGTYTFEHTVKDDATGGVLLGYGPAAENTATLNAASAVVRLKSHAVLDVAGSRLVPEQAMNTLPSGTRFNLLLRPVTAQAQRLSGGAPVAAAVPTSDLGAVTYALGNATDGTLNGPGSRVGVNVTAAGSSTDSELNVQASFTAWVADQGGRTASVQPVTLRYAQAITLP